MFLRCLISHQIRHVPAQEEWPSVSLPADPPDQRCCFIGEGSSIETVFSCIFFSFFSDTIFFNHQRLLKTQVTNYNLAQNLGYV